MIILLNSSFFSKVDIYGKKKISTPIILPRTIHGIGSKREMPSRSYIKIFAI